MKCPKCKYVSYDYLDACRKCGVDLVAFKHDMGLVVLQPGGLDLSLVLGEVEADDLFASVEEEVTMHAGDDDFDIRLDDSGQFEVKRAPIGAPRAGARATEEALAGLDHLTIELDVAAALEGYDERKTPGGLEHLTIEGDAFALPEPSTPTASPPAVPAAGTPPAYVTLALEPESIVTELMPGMLEEIASGPPPYAPETTATQDISLSLSLDISSIDLTSMTSSTDPAERSERAQSVNEEPPESVVDTTISTNELFDADATVAHVEAETRIEPSEVGEAANVTLDSFALSVDDALFASQVDKSAGSDIAAVVKPALSSIDEPSLEEGTLLLAFASTLDMAVSADEPLVPDLPPPTLDDPALTLMDEDALLLRPSLEFPAIAGDATPNNGLTSSDMLALEDLTESALAEHIAIELDAPERDADLRSNFFEDAERTLPHGATETTGATTSTGPEQGFTPSDAVALAALDDTTLPGHLTLELDASVLMAHRSSSTLDDVRLDDPPGDVQSKTSTPQNETDDEEELQLDLDAFDIDDDTHA